MVASLVPRTGAAAVIVAARFAQARPVWSATLTNLDAQPPRICSGTAHYTWAAVREPEPMSMSNAEFRSFVQQDLDKWAQVVKASGATAD